MSEDYNRVDLPARRIAPPSTISSAACAYLSAGAANPSLDWPDPADHAAWQVRRVESDAMFRSMMDAALANAKAHLEDRELGGVPVYVATPPGWDEARGAVYLYIHGGAFVFGGGAFARAQAASNADQLGCRTVSVDYRMPPEHPFPAAPEDCLAVYRALLDAGVAPRRIVIGGGSAGGNLAAVTTLMLRDRRLPMPAGVVLLTPEVDLTEAGDSFRTNAGLDVVLKHGLPQCNALYADGHDLTDPYLSPLLGDLTGFPATLVQSGTRDLFLSNSVLFHRKLRAAGIAAELHVWEAMPHGSFGGTAPEDREVHEEVARFIAARTARA